MREPKYIKFYYNSADILMSLSTNQLSLLTCLIANYENVNGLCQVVIDETAKARICSVLGWNDNTFANALRGLKKANVVTKAGKNEFVLNPTVFGGKK